MKTTTYSDEELDTQYNARASVPDADLFIRRYAELTEVAKRTLLCVADVQYGSSPEETLDIYTSRVGSPVFVFIHGGYWRALSKDDSGFMAPAMVEAGATVVALNYALAPAASLDSIVHQIRSALAWIYLNIGAYGANREQIFLCGSSAGGHLVGTLLQSDWQNHYGVPAAIVKGSIPISGLFDLQPLVKTHVNEWLRLDPASAVRNSPALNRAGAGCDVLIAYAENDTDEFKRQSHLYGDVLLEAGGTVSIMEVANTNHFDVVFDLNNRESQLHRAVIAMMKL